MLLAFLSIFLASDLLLAPWGGSWPRQLPPGLSTPPNETTRSRSSCRAYLHKETFRSAHGFLGTHQRNTCRLYLDCGRHFQVSRQGSSPRLVASSHRRPFCPARKTADPRQPRTVAEPPWHVRHPFPPQVSPSQTSLQRASSTPPAWLLCAAFSAPGSSSAPFLSPTLGPSPYPFPCLACLLQHASRGTTFLSTPRPLLHQPVISFVSFPPLLRPACRCAVSDLVPWRFKSLISFPAPPSTAALLYKCECALPCSVLFHDYFSPIPHPLPFAKLFVSET